MVEETLTNVAIEAGTEAVGEAIADSLAETAVKEATKITVQEGIMLGLSAVGAVAVLAGTIFGVTKLAKFTAKKIKEKKGVAVEQEPVPEAVEVEESETVEATVEE